MAADPIRFNEAATGSHSAIFSGTPLPAPTAAQIVEPFTTTPQAEETIAIDPSNFSRLSCAVSDFSSPGGINRTKYGFSYGNGADGTWTEHFLPVDLNNRLVTNDGLTWDVNSDPFLTIGNNGQCYMLNIFFNGVTNPNDMSNGLYMSKANVLIGGPDPQFTQSFPIQVWSDPNTQFFGDKPAIAIDNTTVPSTSAHPGSLYVSWTRFLGAFQNRIRISHSRDNGQTWTSPTGLSPDDQVGLVQGSRVRVGPHGEVFVGWVVQVNASTSQLWFIRSLDGGNTWRAPHPISPTFTNINIGSSYRFNDFPAMVVDPVSGSIHIVYNDENNFIEGANVKYIRSVDGGVTFSSPIRINDAIGVAKNQFQPAIHIDEVGHIFACWFDSRNSSNPQILDVYMSMSQETSPGIWRPNTRVTPTSFPCGTVKFIGDYMGIRAGGGFVHPIWTDGGFNNGVCQTTTIPII